MKKKTIVKVIFTMIEVNYITTSHLLLTGMVSVLIIRKCIVIDCPKPGKDTAVIDDVCFLQFFGKEQFQ